MMLDVRTIVVMLIVSSVLMTATLAIGIRSGRGSGFAKWNAGLGLYALGWMLVAGRGVLPDLIALSFADALLLAGLCFQLAAVIEYGAGRPPRWLLVAPGPLLFAATVPVMDDYSAFTALVSLAYVAAFALIALRAVQLGGRAGPARWMLAGSYLAAAVVLLVRAIILLGDAEASSGLFSGSAVHIAAFLVIFAVTATGSISFLLMLRELAEARLRKLAMFDPLTDLYNRGALMDLAERELARTRRAGSALAVLMLDLDHFKGVNDRFGHQAGDRVLTDFAAIAKRCVRAGDLVGRYGGEEFCAVLPGAAEGQALAVAERIRMAVCERPLGGLPQTTTISVGVALCDPGTHYVLDSAIARADEALYQAKNTGRNRVAALPLRAARSEPARKTPTAEAAKSDYRLGQRPT